MAQDTEEPALPNVIEMAWGKRERPTKGPKRGLSLQQIVDAAIAVALADGLGAVSMSRVAGELGVSTMSLYRYVSAKDDLLALMADSAYGPAPRTEDADESWRDGLSRWAWTERSQLQRHLWVLEVPVAGMQLIMPNQLAWLEAGLWCMRDISLPAIQKMSSMLLVTSYVRAETALQQQFAEGMAAARASSQEIMSSYGQIIARVTDPATFPHLHEVVASGMFDADDGPDDEFIFGLGRILDGIEALVTASP